MDREKVIKGLDLCSNALYCADPYSRCSQCPYRTKDMTGTDEMNCSDVLMADALALMKEQDDEHRRLLSWLGKFCRHIDNGDAWLTDEENIAFFKEKMKQQFGWDTD